MTLDVTGAEVLHSPNFYSILTRINAGPNIMGLDNVLAAALSIWIAALPMSGVIDPFIYELPPNIDTKDFTAFRFISTQYGFGYGTRSTSVYLSITVLLLYCVVTITYMLYTFVTGLASTAWNSGVELIALALQSKQPDHLGHTGVGIDSLKTLGESVGIRVNTDNEVELVFAHDRDFETRGLRKLERNAAY
jgi:hypothetical protein